MDGLAFHALTYLGVSFRHRGRSRRGLDCAGLVILASRDAGYLAVDREVYGREPWRDGLRAQVAMNLGEPLDRAPQVDDVVLMRMRPEAEPSHLAIVTPYELSDARLGLVHTYANVGMVCTHSMDAIWASRIVEVYAWPA